MSSIVRVLKILAFVIATAIVEVALLVHIDMLGAHPSFMILIPIVSGYLMGSSTGAVMGFVSGMTADLFVPTPFGLTALVWICTGYLAGLSASLFSAATDGDAVASLSGTTSGAQVAAQTGAVPIALVCMLLAGTAQVGYALLGALFGVPAMLTGYLLRSLPVIVIGAVVGAGPMLIAARWAFKRGVHSGRRGALFPVAGSAGVVRR